MNRGRAGSTSKVKAPARSRSSLGQVEPSKANTRPIVSRGGLRGDKLKPVSNTKKSLGMGGAHTSKENRHGPSSSSASKGTTYNFTEGQKGVVDSLVNDEFFRNAFAVDKSVKLHRGPEIKGIVKSGEEPYAASTDDGDRDDGATKAKKSTTNFMNARLSTPQEKLSWLSERPKVVPKVPKPKKKSKEKQLPRVDVDELVAQYKSKTLKPPQTAPVMPAQLAKQLNGESDAIKPSPFRDAPIALRLMCESPINVMNMETDDFECNICFELLAEPVTVVCGHSFCRQCVAVASTLDEARCPVCSSILPRVQPVVNSFMASTIEKKFPYEYKRRCTDLSSNPIVIDSHRKTVEAALSAGSSFIF